MPKAGWRPQTGFVTIYPIAQIALTLAVCLASAGCSGSGQAIHAGSAPPVFPVSVMIAEPQDVPIFQEYIGTTFALNTVQVNSRVNGYIEQWLFRPGDLVKANQLLYVIDPRSYRAEVQRAEAEVARASAQVSFAKEGVEVLRAESELAQAEATLIKADQDVARVKPLVAERALPEQDLDAVTAAQRVARNIFQARQANLKQTRLTQKSNIEQSEAALQAQRAALRLAELNLGFTEVRSPVTGRAGETTIQVGGLASANALEPLTLVSPLDPIYVEFTVTERDYLTYSKDNAMAGQTPKAALAKVPLSLLLADGSTYPHVGTFRFADRAVNVETGTLKLSAEFPNPARTLLPGQFSRVRMSTALRKAVYTVPQRAVQEMQGLRQVMVVDKDNVVAQRTVTVTDRLGPWWIVEKGLQAGDRVVVDGLQKALPGAKVAPKVVTVDAPEGGRQ